MMSRVGYTVIAGTRVAGSHTSQIIPDVLCGRNEKRAKFS